MQRWEASSRRSSANHGNETSPLTCATGVASNADSDAPQLEEGDGGALSAAKPGDGDASPPPNLRSPRPDAPSPRYPCIRCGFPCAGSRAGGMFFGSGAFEWDLFWEYIRQEKHGFPARFSRACQPRARSFVGKVAEADITCYALRGARAVLCLVLGSHVDTTIPSRNNSRVAW